MAKGRSPVAGSLHLVLANCALIAVVFGLAVWRFFVAGESLPAAPCSSIAQHGFFCLFVLVCSWTDLDDRYRCRAVLETGQWLDAGHTNWQPDGCLAHQFNPVQLESCLQERHLLFIGDSNVRQLFYSAAKLLDPEIDTQGPKHSDRSLVARNVHFEFIWDPFLNDSRTLNLLLGDRSSFFPSDDLPSPPTLLVMGSGLWYLRHYEPAEAIQRWSMTVDRLFDAATSMGGMLADQIILLPVQVVVPSKLSPERLATVHADDVAAMNADLEARLASAIDQRNSFALVGAPAFNVMVAGAEEETSDGLHFSEAVSSLRANLLYNFRCADLLPKTYPFDNTCCSTYPKPNFIQFSLLALLILWGPLGIHLHHYGMYKSYLFCPFLTRLNSCPVTGSPLARFFPSEEILVSCTVFGFAITFCYFTDRTSLFLKESKQFDPLVFGVIMLVALVAGLATMSKPEKDLGFLNRDQTDEWKGWMQLAILIYRESLRQSPFPNSELTL
jgi:hypothetical protein